MVPMDVFDNIHDAHELIGVAVGAASMCWENVSGAGVFDSTLAAKIADAAYARLQMILADRFSEDPHVHERRL